MCYITLGWKGLSETIKAGNTKGGSITVPLASYLTNLESVV
jgi:hypothetical protein